MKTLDNALKSYFNTSDSKRLNLKHIFYDSEKHNYYLCNGYSIIRLNYNNLKDKEKIDYIISAYGLSDNKERTIEISNFDKTFGNYNHCNYIDIDTLEVKKDMFNHKIITINGRGFDLKEINRIKRVLGGNKFGIFYSTENDNSISITSKNGYAFLLGCIKY